MLYGAGGAGNKSLQKKAARAEAVNTIGITLSKWGGSIHRQSGPIAAVKVSASVLTRIRCDKWWSRSCRRQVSLHCLRSSSSVGKESEARPELVAVPGTASRREALWQKNFEQLLAFKAEHGHLVVPSSGQWSSLSGWVTYQRRLLRCGKLSHERHASLEKLGLFSEEPSSLLHGQLQRPTARAKWEKRFQELRDFKAEHGHVMVPGDSPWSSLSRWLAYQLLKRKQGTLSKERQDALEELGFCWEESVLAASVAEAKWQKRLQELRNFIAQHGHTNVPTHSPRSSLANWVVYQRVLWRRGTLSQGHKDALEELGFCWKPGAEVAPGTQSGGTSREATCRVDERSTHDEKWAEKFKELCEFSKAHGHTRVPSNTNLHSWLHHQRRMFAKGNLSGERRKHLESIGLNLSVRPRVAWEVRLEELRAFQDVYGHCSVPATWRHNKTLGSWVIAQRKHYRNGTLRPERKEALEQLGFQWEARRPGKVSSRSLHMRQNVSPWALMNSRSDGNTSSQRVDVAWIGGSEVQEVRQRLHHCPAEFCVQQHDGSSSTMVRQLKALRSSSVGGWGKGSSAYEEKQQFVFNHVSAWWRGDGEDKPCWRDARGKVRDMRYNYAVQAKQRKIKPDIVIEVEEIDRNEIWGLVIEVDEFAHRRGHHYSWQAEEERMQDLQATLGVPLKIIRFNPDPDVTNPMALDDRTQVLVKHIVESMQTAPVRDLEVAYVLY